MPIATKQPALKERILDAIPNYRSTLERARALSTLTLSGLDGMGNISDLNVAYYDRISTAVDSGVSDLTALRDAYAADVSALQGKGQFHQLAVQVMQHARNAATQLLVDHADVALGILRGELDTLMGDVDRNRPAITTQALSAEHAIAAGTQAVTDWQTVNALLARYDEIRREHRDWVKRQGGDNQMPGFVAVGQTARFLDVDPTWLYRRATTTAPTGGDTTTITAWLNRHRGTTIDPGDAHRTDVWPNTYRPNEWLLIVADNDPWLPDADIINGCYGIADEMFRNAINSTPTWMLSRLAELTTLGATTNLQ